MKGNRREEAIKRKKRKKLIIVTVCVLAVATIAALVIFNMFRQGEARIYTDGRQTVTLNGNGTFTALLAHNNTMNGTYTEITEGGVTTISFVYGGATANGRIVNHVLTIPDEWDDNHGHGKELRLRGSQQQNPHDDDHDHDHDDDDHDHDHDDHDDDDHDH